MSIREDRAQRIDWLLLVMTLALITFGWMMIIAVNYREGAFNLFDLNTQHGRQLVRIGIGMVIGLVVLLLDYKFLTGLPWVFYGLMIGLLVLTIFIARDVKGAQAWIHIGSFSLQPGELAKPFTALALAAFISTIGSSLATWRARFISLGIILLPSALIILQQDTGTAIVYLSLVLVLYREGFPVTFPLLVVYFGVVTMAIIKWGDWQVIVVLAVVFGIIGGLMATSFKQYRKHIFRMAALLVATALFGLFVVEPIFYKVLQPHQQVRIYAMLGKEVSEGANYNVLQSKIAISSGGVSGKGYLEGTMAKGEFVPEQSTDFIFTVVGEEFGFAGTAALILFFLLFLLRILYLSERQRSHFTRVYGYGVASILFVHLVVNIGMTIGMVPVIGIPLPFISYGGSSLWAFILLVAILLKLDANRMLVLR